MNVHFNTKRVVGRKYHLCDACGQEIGAGWFSMVEAGVFYGEFFYRRTHPICYEIWQKSLEGDELGYFSDCLEGWLSSMLEPEDFEKAWRHAWDEYRGS